MSDPIDEDDFDPYDIINIDFSHPRNCELFAEYWSSLKQKHMEDEEMIPWVFEALLRMIQNLNERVTELEKEKCQNTTS